MTNNKRIDSQQITRNLYFTYTNAIGVEAEMRCQASPENSYFTSHHNCFAPYELTNLPGNVRGTISNRILFCVCTHGRLTDNHAYSVYSEILNSTVCYITPDKIRILAGSQAAYELLKFGNHNSKA